MGSPMSSGLKLTYLVLLFALAISPAAAQVGPPVSLSVSSPYIALGSAATLYWAVSLNPTPTLSIDNGVGAVACCTGTVNVSPTVTTTYTLTATNTQGTVTAKTTVWVVPPVNSDP